MLVMYVGRVCVCVCMCVCVSVIFSMVTMQQTHTGIVE